MKKRLLITSIVMMLVVAVALSTATYAWFTSATAVTATSITMEAGTSATSALGIAWNASAGTPNTPAFNSGYTTQITADAPSAIQPAAPAALTDAEPVFKTAYIDAGGNFTANGETTPVYRFANDTASSQLIHVANLATSGTTGVKVVINVADPDDGSECKALVRVAIFEVAGETPTWTYKGLMSGGTSAANDTAVGAIAKDASAAALLTGTSTAEVALGNIAAQTEKTYAVYVWLDGALFNEAQSGKKAKVGLTFSAVAAA